MPEALDITLTLDSGLVQSILIDGWPANVPFPRIQVMDSDGTAIDTGPAFTRSSSAPELVGMASHLPDAVAQLKILGIEYVLVEYQGSNGRGQMKLCGFQPSKLHDRAAPFISQGVSNEIKAFFHSILADRHPDCFDSWGSTGVFRWFLEPERLVHRHESGRFDSRTFVYHGL